MHCSTCNVESGPTLFCHVCDNYLPQPAIGVKAGLVRRFVAVLLDNVVAWGVLVIFIGRLGSNPVITDLDKIIFMVTCLAMIVYAGAFFVALAQGRTPGKWLLGIRAVDKRN